MPLNLHPAFTYQVIAPAGSQVYRADVPQRPPIAEVEVETAGKHKHQPSADYVAALRELREEQQTARQNLALRTYLEVAHYEGNFQLVDVYS